MPEVGILGFGRCGQLAARVMGGRHHLIAADREDRRREAAALGVAWGEVPEVARLPHVLLAVPIRALPEALDALVPHLRPGALVADVGSVKVRPMEWMAERIPPGVRWVGTHPLFGPDSVREQGVQGQRIAICAAPGQEEAADAATAFAVDLGLDPMHLTAEEHDRSMARSQALVFLLARALRRAEVGTPLHGTPSERRVFSALRLVDADTDELYEDILTLNPFAAAVTATLIDAVCDEAERLAPLARPGGEGGGR